MKQRWTFCLGWHYRYKHPIPHVQTMTRAYSEGQTADSHPAEPSFKGKVSFWKLDVHSSLRPIAPDERWGRLSVRKPAMQSERLRLSAQASDVNPTSSADPIRKQMTHANQKLLFICHIFWEGGTYFWQMSRAFLCAGKKKRLKCGLVLPCLGTAKRWRVGPLKGLSGLQSTLHKNKGEPFSPHKFPSFVHVEEDTLSPWGPEGLQTDNGMQTALKNKLHWDNLKAAPQALRRASTPDLPLLLNLNKAQPTRLKSSFLWIKLPLQGKYANATQAPCLRPLLPKYLFSVWIPPATLHCPTGDQPSNSASFKLLTGRSLARHCL